MVWCGVVWCGVVWCGVMALRDGGGSYDVSIMKRGAGMRLWKYWLKVISGNSDKVCEVTLKVVMTSKMLKGSDNGVRMLVDSSEER